MPRQSQPDIPPVGGLLRFLVSSSAEGVRAVELARLGEAAGLERELRVLLARLAECHAEALLCRLVLELRQAPVPPGRVLPARRLLRT